MSYRLRQLALVACFAGIGLIAAKSQVRSPHDLDSYTDAQLERDLLDELDDIYAELGDPDGEYDLDVLKADIMDALGDAGDEGYEDEIDMADLVDQMSEDSTTVEDVVDEALERADELSARTESPGWRIVPVGFSGLGLSTQGHDRRSKAKVAVEQTAKALRDAIRAR
jgi:hypothetical protein